MLEAIKLSKKYGAHKALTDLNLTVAPGEVFCLLGANGAGKTTTINLFMNFIQATSGQVKVNGFDISSEPSVSRKHLAYIPENLNLYGKLTGLENLQFFAGLSGVKPDKSTAEMLLKAVGLQAEAVNKHVAKYSKGMRQKVGVAIAKAKQADNLLLDEPTSGLDPQASNDFARLLQDMKQNNVAILMATHDLFRAKESGTHIGIMKGGRLIHSLNSDEVTLRDLEHLYLETMKSDAHVEASR